MDKILNDSMGSIRHANLGNPGRRGLGRMVLDSLLRHARKARVRRVFLDTDEQWGSARRFYEKNGFVECQRKRWQGTILVLYERALADGRP